MSADDLKTYNLQLQQVEAALTNDPENEELLQLKNDLTEMVTLTTSLLAEESQPRMTNVRRDIDISGIQPDSVQYKWSKGDSCFAPWSRDGRLNPATITEVLNDGRVSVSFDGYSVFETCFLTQIKHPSQVSDFIKQKSRKSQFEMIREKKKKKSQKRSQKLREVEQQRESEKRNWLNFSSKMRKGTTKKSIFNSPDAFDGKIGVGTCGLGGVGMTESTNVPVPRFI